MAKKFKLGPIQKIWLDTLERYPRRKTEGTLGYKTKTAYKACCLGAALICYREYMVKKMPFVKNGDVEQILSGDDEAILKSDYRKIGLRSANGKLKKPIVNMDGNTDDDLTDMNDGGDYTWPQIAKYIRENPQNVFTKSV